ncbi:MAG: TIGR03560 family F420-dependent LLM class oxidoreductase [Chloroflexi bacterium]|nr:TIGR03560 family F420-dependent LLM class oxidoreductase [Chloroflexota bacterium]
MDVGVQLEPQFGFSFRDLVDISRDAEATGFRAVWLSDHLFLNRDSVATDCLEAWTALAGLATSTKTIRLGTMVTCQSYRNPALLAKIAAGVDRMSGGRLEFGIGAGWKELEYRAYGYEFPPPGVRIDQLRETLEICTRMWRDERATFHGAHYRVDEALCAPKPLQDPLPIWIGGRKPRLLRLTARWAHVFNYLPEGGFPTPQQMRDAMREVDNVCRSLGRDPATLRRSVFLYILVAATEGEAMTIASEVAGRAKLTVEDWLAARPGIVMGTPERVLARLKEYGAAGAQDVNAMFPYRFERQMVKLLGEGVLPGLR